MNEDDYDFDITENSRLSALFGKDYEAGNSSLIYKAPKQPDGVSNNSRSTIPKTFHKFIKLYTNDGTLCGKYIIAIVSSELNSSEILIYQTKKKIFLRFPTCGKSLYTDNNTLVLNEKNQQYQLVFENFKDLVDFTREFVQNGGYIKEIVKKSNASLNVNLKNEICLENTAEKAYEEVNDEVTISKSNKKERKDILTRLEKMGMPQILPIQKEGEDMENYTISERNMSSKMNAGSSKTNTLITDDENLQVQSVISEKVDHPNENCGISPTVYITQEQTNSLTSVLEDCQQNNKELKEAISLLTSTLKEIIPTAEIGDKNEAKKLKSRIKILELKSENLQSELNRCLENKRERNILESIPVQKENCQCENSCQTDDSEFNRDFVNQMELIFKQIIDIIKPLPLSLNEIKKLKNLKESIKNFESLSGLLPHFEFIDENDILNDKTQSSVARNEFVIELKKVMNEMYQNICSTESSSDTKELLAKQIKFATVEILKSYDTSLEHLKT